MGSKLSGRSKTCTDTETHAKYTDCTSTPEGCWPWTRGKNGGYGQLYIGSRRNGTYKAKKAHRFALEQRLGRPIQTGMTCLHTCDNPSCQRNDGDEGIYVIRGTSRIRFGHLWEGTQIDNVADMVAKGRNSGRGKAKELRIQNPDGSVTTWEPHEGPMPEWVPTPELVPEPEAEEVAPSLTAEESETERESPSPRHRRS